MKGATGLHARPGSDLVELAMPFHSKILIVHKGKEINAKEVLEILTANINCGDSVLLKAEGEDEQDALDTLVSYLETMEG